MEKFGSIATLFVVGSVFGYLIEVLFRRIFTAKRWVNPGFLIGPYLPLYGFGTAAIYGVFALVDLIPDTVMPYWAEVLLGIALVGVAMTVIEFIAGLIFIKGMKLKLWDYTNRKGNIMGIICPLFSFFWLVAGGLFYALLLNPFTKLLMAIASNPWYVIFIGIILGAMVMDCIISFYYSKTVKKFNNDADLRYDDLKLSFRKQYNFKEKKNHFYGIIDLSSETATNLPEAIEEFEKKHPDVDLMVHYSENKVKDVISNPLEDIKDVNGNLKEDIKEDISKIKEDRKAKKEEKKKQKEK